ncbi:hypothetical protein NDN08_004540 [Rhodosorus marinus]|uniref:Serpin domain-containing protein n=1 Tax=Rhodosorus marinus TaxID=101924 RepID=A0AAV8UQK2_9RHOD|nr:hypothetical protein NDN08_004540 [Rhodosorus marinus]
MGKGKGVASQSLTVRVFLGALGLWIVWFFGFRGRIERPEVFQRDLELAKEAAVVGGFCGVGMKDDELVKSVNAFGSSVFDAMIASNPKENVFFSPLSIAAAMSMVRLGTTAGSAGEKELDKFLPCAGNVLENLTEELQIDTEAVQTKFVNSLWMSESLKPAYKWQMDKLSVHTAALPTSPDPINEWVEAQTNGLIKNLLAKLHKDAIAMLVNAVYFKGQWSSQFSEKATEDALFTQADGSTETCKMMKTFQTSFMYRKLPSGEASVKLPYGKSGDFHAVVTLPSPGDVPNPHGAISSAPWEMQKVKVQMPRFKVEYAASVKDILRSMGIESIFSELGMLKGICTRDDAIIGDVAHKAVIEVDEYGTKAAAATAVTMMRMSLGRPPIEFLVDRPFAFTILHRSGMVLFSGVIKKPSFF